jgi:metal-responsive CopG/Arc/MetJ family transcriptional regulator
METANLTVRLDRSLDELLTRVSRRAGKSRSEVARDALRRYLRGSEFDVLRQKMTPYANARGYLTDADVFDEVS